MDIKLFDEEGFWGEILCVGFGNNSSAVIVPQIEDAIARGESEIIFRINTIGGSVVHAFAIYNALIRAKDAGIKVITTNEGLCASAGTIVYMAGEERWAYTSLFMIHKPAQDMWWFGLMNADDMRKEADQLDKWQTEIVSVYQPAGLDDKAINELVNSESWLTSGEAVALGFSTVLKTGTKKADILEPIMNRLQQSTPVNISQYSNRIFNTIAPKNMNTEASQILNEVKENTKKNTTLMQGIMNFLGIKTVTNEAGEEVVIAEDAPKGDETETTETTETSTTEESTEVVIADDGATTTTETETETTVTEEVPAPPAPDVVALSARITELEAQLALSNTAVANSNALLAQVAQVQSKFKVPAVKQDFSKNNADAENNAGAKFVKPTKK